MGILVTKWKGREKRKAVIGETLFYFFFFDVKKE